MKILITGITGFVGSHMAEYYLNKGVEIYGTYRWRSKTNNIDHIKDKIHLLYADMNDAHSLEKVIKEVKPDRIHHLAAQSFVPMSWKAPTDTFNTNAIGTIHLFEAIKNIQNLCDPLIHVAGSSEEYGMIYEDELPIKETNPLRPLSPYGVSKIAQDMLCYQYNKSYGLKTILTRAFNHTGPRRGDVFVTSNFARQIVEIEKGKKEPIMYVGNLE
ncbi:MAG: GDP-mannose 4,6-dehydratase, partial [Candidatus Aenigmarchaeota archaeon]|nr:GDP-mannose 4,6-dehydratase [Candidatus Aenigmarchaeota archaeon]